MQTNVLEYLENSVERYQNKTAFTDGQETLTYGQFYAMARGAGSALCHLGYQKEPIVVFMKRSPSAIAAFMAVLYSGNIYIPLDEELPRARIEMIFESVKPRAVICGENTQKALASYAHGAKVHLFSELCQTEADDAALAAVRAKTLDTDPLYIVFTSGSTGRPKGVLANHRNVIDYVDALSKVLQADENSIFGMQVPLYVDACLKEIYPALKNGGSTVLIPKGHFLFPMRLVEFMNQHQINTVCWVVSALTMISGFGVLEKVVPQYLHTVAFGSEVFPVKQFNLWRSHLPNARFINLYGPTECTGMSCFYEATRDFAENEAIPIGKPFPNTEVFLVDDDGSLVTEANTQGEIYIRGAGVTLGYYGDAERTKEVFVQNPLQNLWPETVYRTGDLAKYNADGDLVYISRRDYQIKHMGYRIELSEIEAAACRMENIQAAACVFLKEKDKIVLFYTPASAENAPDVKDVTIYLRKMLASYMIPATIQMLDKMPLTDNGKINRVSLTQQADTL